MGFFRVGSQTYVTKKMTNKNTPFLNSQFSKIIGKGKISRKLNSFEGDVQIIPAIDFDYIHNVLNFSSYFWKTREFLCEEVTISFLEYLHNTSRKHSHCFLFVRITLVSHWPSRTRKARKGCTKKLKINKNIHTLIN